MVIDTLGALHQNISPNYTYFDTGNVISCYGTAIAMARFLLLYENKASNITTVASPDSEPLRVKPFDTVTWYRHSYCVDPSTTPPTVYDPIFTEPLPEAEYLHAMFENADQLVVSYLFRHGPRGFNP